MRYAITHGIRNSGMDPVHKPDGLAQVKGLKIPSDVSLVVSGTGMRFEEIRINVAGLANLPMKVSPFVGSADSFESPGTIVLACGSTCGLADYIGVNNTLRFDGWGFVSDQPDGTLFACGAEFLCALGLAKPGKGVLYALDVEARTVTLLQQD